MQYIFRFSQLSWNCFFSNGFYCWSRKWSINKHLVAIRIVSPVPGDFHEGRDSWYRFLRMEGWALHQPWNQPFWVVDKSSQLNSHLIRLPRNIKQNIKTIIHVVHFKKIFHVNFLIIGGIKWKGVGGKWWLSL